MDRMQMSTVGKSLRRQTQDQKPKTKNFSYKIKDDDDAGRKLHKSSALGNSKKGDFKAVDIEPSREKANKVSISNG